VIVEELLERQFRGQGRYLRSCHPRDLVALIVSRASFLGQKPELTNESLNEACKTYFVD
jgi:hypothetical protein